MPSSSSSSSHSSPFPSLSVSSWELLMTAGQLSRESWWPSPSLDRSGTQLHTQRSKDQRGEVTQVPVLVGVTGVTDQVVVCVSLR